MSSSLRIFPSLFSSQKQFFCTQSLLPRLCFHTSIVRDSSISESGSFPEQQLDSGVAIRSIQARFATGRKRRPILAEEIPSRLMSGAWETFRRAEFLGFERQQVVASSSDENNGGIFEAELQETTDGDSKIGKTSEESRMVDEDCQNKRDHTQNSLHVARYHTGTLVASNGIESSVNQCRNKNEKNRHSCGGSRASQKYSNEKNCQDCSHSEEILVEERNCARIITLNRPRVLNALTSSMVNQIFDLYEKWEKDCNVHFILLKGAGHAFSAGGDLRWFYSLTKIENSWKNIVLRKYLLDYRLYSYKKTIVAILHGLVMGGGAGLTIPCKFKIVTEKTVFAMPEASIGFHTDCGASYFLSRLPGYLGEYLGLTGARLSGAEMIRCGLATHFVPTERLAELEKSLLEINSGDYAIIQEKIEDYNIFATIEDHSILHSVSLIDKCFSKENVEDILSTLVNENDAVSSPKWLEEAIKILRKTSPTSLKATLRSIQEGRGKTLTECIYQEYHLTLHFLMGTISNDFYEGIRATVIDKDHAPKWKPSCLSEITTENLDLIFTPVEEEENELQTKRRKCL